MDSVQPADRTKPTLQDASTISPSSPQSSNQAERGDGGQVARPGPEIKSTDPFADLEHKQPNRLSATVSRQQTKDEYYG